MAKKKFYVVWKGVNPGIYSSWTDCQLQIQGYKAVKLTDYQKNEENPNMKQAIEGNENNVVKKF